MVNGKKKRHCRYIEFGVWESSETFSMEINATAPSYCTISAYDRFPRNTLFWIVGGSVLIIGITKDDISDLIKPHLFMIVLGITGAVIFSSGSKRYFKSRI